MDGHHSKAIDYRPLWGTVLPGRNDSQWTIRNMRPTLTRVNVGRRAPSSEIVTAAQRRPLQMDSIELAAVLKRRRPGCVLIQKFQFLNLACA